MINPHQFIAELNSRGLSFFTGVPDSLLKDFCAALEHECGSKQSVTAANEGNAIAMAMGHYMATGRPALVYMQNSGLGNAVNPIASLADPEVYGIPMILLVGWRGEPGKKDEPQHVKQGRITEAQLDLLEIPYSVIDERSELQPVLDEVFARLELMKSPVAILVRKGAFSPFEGTSARTKKPGLLREQAISAILDGAADDLIVATTGKTSRELFELRKARNESQRDFLTVGGMGHASSIALAAAMARPDRRFICLDGDGAALMHLGAMPVIAACEAGNLLHVLLNNQAHESVGGQPTLVDKVDFKALSLACGYKNYRCADDIAGIAQALSHLRANQGPSMLEIKIGVGSRKDLGRPTSTPEQNKRAFMNAIRNVAE